MLVEDDESFQLVNQLGLETLVAVRPPSTTTSTGTTTTNPIVTTTTNPSLVTTTAAAQKLGLSTTLTASVSEVNVYVIAESEKGQ